MCSYTLLKITFGALCNADQNLQMLTGMWVAMRTAATGSHINRRICCSYIKLKWSCECRSVHWATSPTPASNIKTWIIMRKRWTMSSCFPLLRPPHVNVESCFVAVVDTFIQLHAPKVFQKSFYFQDFVLFPNWSWSSRCFTWKSRSTSVAFKPALSSDISFEIFFSFRKGGKN